MHRKTRDVDLMNDSFQLRLIASAICLGILSSPVYAESFPLSDVVPASVPDAQRAMLQSHAQKLADTMFNHLLLQLDEIDRVSGLSEDQQRVLTVAAKGAVQEALDIWLGMIAEIDAAKAGENNIVLPPGIGLAHANLQRFENNGVIHVEGQLLIEPRRDKIVQLMDVVAALVDRNGVVRDREVPQRGEFVAELFGVEVQHDDVQMMERPLLNVADNVLWTTTLVRILTREQKTALVQAQAEREALPREWRHERVLVEIDRHLLLDSAQRDALTERVTKFLEMPQIKRWLERRPGFEDAALAQMALKAIPIADVKDLLSEQQSYQWQQLLNDDKPVGAIRDLQIQRGF